MTTAKSLFRLRPRFDSDADKIQSHPVEAAAAAAALPIQCYRRRRRHFHQSHSPAAAAILNYIAFQRSAEEKEGRHCGKFHDGEEKVSVPSSYSRFQSRQMGPITVYRNVKPIAITRGEFHPSLGKRTAIHLPQKDIFFYSCSCRRRRVEFNQGRLEHDAGLQLTNKSSVMTSLSLFPSSLFL